nr:D-alanine--D-alanine ligase [Bacteroidota bacterium]
MRVGILFGGRSREREISFAGGRTVYDLLDKSLFTPVPLFIDSLGNIILLDWQYLYKGTIRDFYPPASFCPATADKYQLYIESLGKLGHDDTEKLINTVGRRIKIEELPQLIDFAFLTLHGSYGEDGSIQGLLSFLDIPYSGSGILPSSIGIDKQVQKKLMGRMNTLKADSLYIKREEWLGNSSFKNAFFDKIKSRFQLPVVVKSATQGSSIG